MAKITTKTTTGAALFPEECYWRDLVAFWLADDIFMPPTSSLSVITPGMMSIHA